MPRILRLAASLLLAPCVPSLVIAQARVDVPEDCGSERELSSELVRLLGAERAAEALPERLQIRRAGDGAHLLVLQLRGERRELRDPDCRALFKTAVVMAAAVVDPRVQTQPATAEPARPRSAVAPPPRAAKPAAQPAPVDSDDAAAQDAQDGDAGGSTAETDPFRAGAWFGAGAAIALLPQLSPLLELSGTLASGGLGVALAGRYLSPADERAGDAYGVRIHGFGARLAALYDPAPFARLQAGIALDYLAGRGLGSAVQDAADSGTALAFALEAALIPLRVGQARLSLGVAGHYALVRPSFEITGYGEVFRTPRIGAAAIARLGWEFR